MAQRFEVLMIDLPFPDIAQMRNQVVDVSDDAIIAQKREMAELLRSVLLIAQNCTSGICPISTRAITAAVQMNELYAQHAPDADRLEHLRETCAGIVTCLELCSPHCPAAAKATRLEASASLLGSKYRVRRYRSAENRAAE